MNLIEILKLFASVVSSLVIIGGFIISIFKPIRKRLADWIVRTSGMPTCDDKIDKLIISVNSLDSALNKHIKESNIERNETLRELTEVNKKLDLSFENQKNTCRNMITDMYYKYGKYGEMPRYKHELLIKTYTNYKAIGGNSYIDEIYDEMKDIKIID